MLPLFWIQRHPQTVFEECLDHHLRVLPFGSAVNVACTRTATCTHRVYSASLQLNCNCLCTCFGPEPDASEIYRKSNVGSAKYPDDTFLLQLRTYPTLGKQIDELCYVPSFSPQDTEALAKAIGWQAPSQRACQLEESNDCPRPLYPPTPLPQLI